MTTNKKNTNNVIVDYPVSVAFILVSDCLFALIYIYFIFFTCI